MRQTDCFLVMEDRGSGSLRRGSPTNRTPSEGRRDPDTQLMVARRHQVITMLVSEKNPLELRYNRCRSSPH